MNARTFLLAAVLSVVAVACDDYAVAPRSGFLCRCDQRERVADYVSSAQTSGISDDSDYYLDRMFAIAVRTYCTRVDSMPVDRNFNALGLDSCEVFYRDTSIRP